MFIALKYAPDIDDPEWGRTRVAGGLLGFAFSVFDGC
ncbi:hypothetical protein CYPRO_2400 [Cyclonatronum proteinivorum]|uniref:Uncharacterized protein n=1 Tax=Cyclonatronum proteinivorum TaxID=1457365 RepID=A0A345UME0_9BACT|nr:hypothetical protein CYPRO_2400 [Cyclonatronum proteinivorum]